MTTKRKYDLLAEAASLDTVAKDKYRAMLLQAITVGDVDPQDLIAVAGACGDTAIRAQSLIEMIDRRRECAELLQVDRSGEVAAAKAERDDANYAVSQLEQELERLKAELAAAQRAAEKAGRTVNELVQAIDSEQRQAERFLETTGDPEDWQAFDLSWDAARPTVVAFSA